MIKCLTAIAKTVYMEDNVEAEIQTVRKVFIKYGYSTLYGNADRKGNSYEEDCVEKASILFSFRGGTLKRLQKRTEEYYQ